MADPKSQDGGELLKRALVAIDQLQAKLAASETAKQEPIAIVGMACRFPGATSPDELWSNLVAGIDSVTVVPSYRWDAEAFYDPNPDAPGKAYTKWGGFVGDVEHFDAAFFGITPREAVMLDPQQRLLLEMVWDALEDANISPSALAGANGGVFLGMSSMDFVQLLSRTLGPENADAYMASGTSHSIAGGRISYFLGIHGPNITVDTACSSSMVAVHLGVKSLRNREAEFAIAAGVNLTLLPDASIVTSRARMMSPTGRCNSFDESADGYVRSEGCGVVVLKRLSDARRAGNRVLALIRGTAVNQDGRSSGLTAPHGPSQEAVIRAALADGGLTSDDVTFVEAHGTGTALGDPIEVNALAKVFARDNVHRPLVVGSIKANIGHTEPAAGIAGLIKAVQALRHRAMPKQIHLHKRNPHINWDAAAIELPLETTQLKPLPGKTLIGGVNSFGFSGTNSHVVLEEAPPVAAAATAEPGPPDTTTLLAFSARTVDAVNELAGRYADIFDAPGTPCLHEIAAAAPIARSPFPERIGIVAADAAEASVALRTVANGGASPNVVRGRMFAAASPEIVFLFTGQGAQYPGMGQALYESNAAFRDAIDACDALAHQLIGRSLKDIMFGLNGADILVNDTTYTQPALFAIEYALVATWHAWGVEPTAVMGHSVGEYTAACVAGMLSLEDAMRLIVARGALMGALPREGAMAAVFAPEDVVRAAIATAGARLSVAGVNGPTNIVISGAADALVDACAGFAQNGVETQMLNVSHAFHSAMMDPILDEFETVASEVTLNEPRLMLISNISGARMGAEGRRPEYWRKHLREAVRFSDSIAGLQRGGYRLFLEIGPTPILTGMAQRCGGAETCAYVPSLRKGRDDRRSMLEAAGRLYAAGAELNWTGIVGSTKKHVALPRYPFQRQRYWPEGTTGTTPGRLAGTPSGHSLLGNRAKSPVEMYQTRLGVAEQAWARDHRLFEFTPFPAAGFLEMALAAARLSAGPQAQLENIVISQAAILPETGTIEAQVVVGEDGAGQKTVRIYSAAAQDGDATEWRLHASASISQGPATVPNPSETSENAKPDDVDAYYNSLSTSGANYGPAFRVIRSLQTGKRVTVAEVALPETVSAQDYWLHPALLDGCMQVMGVQMKGLTDSLFMPIGAALYRVLQPGVTAGRCRVALSEAEANAKSFTANFTLLDAKGSVVAELLGLDVRQINRASLQNMLRQSGGAKDWCFGVEWRAAEASAQPVDIGGQNWLIFADRGGVGAAFAADLRAKGARCALVERPSVWDAKTVEAAVTEAAPVDRPLHGVALFWSLEARNDFADSGDVDREILEQTTASLISLRAVVDRAARVLVVTRGVQQIGNRDADVVQSALWAFAGVVASEHPTCGLARIDIDPEKDDNVAALLAREAAASDREDRVAYRGGQRYVARLAAQTLQESEPTETRKARPRADGAYIVTGGLTGLGLATAQWLAEKGAGGLVLLGRRAPGAEAVAAIKQMETSGARVSVAQVDVGDQDKLTALLKDVRQSIGPIRGVFHAAGVLDDGMLSEQTPERIAHVLAPKVRGGWALHELTLGDPLDFFVLFSSAAALFGSPGQSNYAAANGFLDGLAAYRQARGLPGLAINWGSWAEIGMAAGVTGEHHRRWVSMGLEMITPEAGVNMLDQLVMKSVRPQMAAVPIMRAKIAAVEPAFYRELAMRGAQATADEVTPDVLGALRSAEPDARRGILEAFVVDQVRKSLALPATQKVDLHETLLNLGMDSLMAMDLRNRLQKAVSARVDVIYLLGGATSVELIGTVMSKLPLGDTAAALEEGWEAELI
jgi:acyl transferase domain-containing protein/aryl carrier-like protein